LSATTPNKLKSPNYNPNDSWRKLDKHRI
jgi:hypothetical protein